MEQKSNEWHQARLGKFTASEIYKLMGSGKAKDAVFSDTGYTYIKQKVGEYLTNTRNEISSKAMEWGNEYEPMARKWYENITKTKVQDQGFVMLNESDCFGASPDGLLENRIIEIKCPYETSNFIDLVLSLKLGTFKKDYPNYYWQVQMCMLVCEKDLCDFIVFDPRIDSNYGIYIKEIERNIEDQDLLINKISLAQKEFNSIISHFNL